MDNQNHKPRFQLRTSHWHSVMFQMDQPWLKRISASYQTRPALWTCQRTLREEGTIMTPRDQEFHPVLLPDTWGILCLSSASGQRNPGEVPEAMCTNTTTKTTLHIVHINAFFNLKKKKISSICKQFRLNLFLFCEWTLF